MDIDRIKSRVREVPDFPREGILFRDITPVLQDGPALKAAVGHLLEPFRGEALDLVVGIESRGFIFGSLAALELDVGFVPVRKPGKLPWKVHRQAYELEYGTDAVEMHVDAVGEGQRILIVDDVLATGGTAAATIGLTERAGATIVGLSFLVELQALEGRSRLGDRPFHSVIRY